MSVSMKTKRASSRRQSPRVTCTDRGCSLSRSLSGMGSAALRHGADDEHEGHEGENRKPGGGVADEAEHQSHLRPAARSFASSSTIASYRCVIGGSWSSGTIGTVIERGFGLRGRSQPTNASAGSRWSPTP